MTYFSILTKDLILALLSELIRSYPDVWLLFGRCPGTKISEVHLVEAAHDDNPDDPVHCHNGSWLSVDLLQRLRLSMAAILVHWGPWHFILRFVLTVLHIGLFEAKGEAQGRYVSHLLGRGSLDKRQS